MKRRKQKIYECTCCGEPPDDGEYLWFRKSKDLKKFYVKIVNNPLRLKAI